MKRIFFAVMMLFSTLSLADSGTDSLRAQREERAACSSGNSSDCYAAMQRTQQANRNMYQDIDRRQQDRVQRDQDTIRDEQLREQVRRQNRW